MSTNRLLNGITEHIRSKKILSDVNNRENLSFEGRLSIPNQAFDCLIKKDGEPQTIIFTYSATKMLDNLRHNAKAQTHYRDSHHIKDKRIEFMCLGYIDPVGDIVIEDIVSPLNTILVDKIEKDPSITNDEIKKYAFGNFISSRKIKEIMESSFKQHISSKDPNDYTLVALRGFTSPQAENGENHIKLKDLVDCIVPGNIKPLDNIITGVVNLTPPTPENPNGSLECIIIPHKTHSNGTTAPSRIFNVISAFEERPNDKSSPSLNPSPISQSNQNLTGLPPRKYLTIDNLEP